MPTTGANVESVRALVSGVTSFGSVAVTVGANVVSVRLAVVGVTTVVGVVNKTYPPAQSVFCVVPSHFCVPAPVVTLLCQPIAIFVPSPPLPPELKFSVPLHEPFEVSPSPETPLLLSLPMNAIIKSPLAMLAVVVGKLPPVPLPLLVPLSYGLLAEPVTLTAITTFAVAAGEKFTDMVSVVMTSAVVIADL